MPTATTRHELAVLSHELRQPMAAICAAAEILKGDSIPERRARAVRIIEEQIGYLARLVDRMADASPMASALAARPELLDARIVLREAISMVGFEFERRQHAIIVSESPQPAWVSADPTRLKQIFANLLNNAAAYTPPRGRITVSLVVHEGQVQCRVEDNGHGIPLDALNRIFELFERGADHASSPGSGIGLAVVKELVELHGGSVSATSAGPGHGSEFLVTFPYAKSPAARSQPREC